MNKFQKISFRSFGDFYDFLPPEEQELVDFLRDIILESEPDLSEKLAYNVPFYYYHRRICYIWPSAIPWGGLEPGSGVALGFTKGRQLAGDYLSGGNGKDVRYRLFRQVQEIDPLLVRYLVREAVELDR